MFDALKTGRKFLLTHTHSTGLVLCLAELEKELIILTNSLAFTRAIHQINYFQWSSQFLYICFHNIQICFVLF